MITLLLNDNAITGYGLKVACDLPLPEEDLSGQSSSSETAELGFKPKKLKVSLNIPFDTPAKLQQLVQLTQATMASGKRQVYTIVNQTAEAFGVRQVRFSDRFMAQELDDSQAWAVSFSLLEHQSIPEKEEIIRTQQSAVPVQKSDKVTASEAETETPEELTWFEKSVLKPANDALSDESVDADEI